LVLLLKAVNAAVDRKNALFMEKMASGKGAKKGGRVASAGGVGGWRMPGGKEWVASLDAEAAAAFARLPATLHEETVGLPDQGALLSVHVPRWMEGLRVSKDGEAASGPTDEAAELWPDAPAAALTAHAAVQDAVAAAVPAEELLVRLGWDASGEARKVAGARVAGLAGPAAALYDALVRLGAKVAQVQGGATRVHLPDMVHAFGAAGCGFSPRSAHSQIYQLADTSPALVLAGTAEIPLITSVANDILPTRSLPLRRVAVGSAFRAEAGGGGIRSGGLYRLHQFAKAELVTVCTPDDVDAEYQHLLDIQHAVLRTLDLPYRVINMAPAECGAPARRKQDMEVFVPTRGWSEVSSTSDCGDYQAIRLAIRHKEHGGKPSWCATLNGTAAAAPRLLLALLELGQVRAAAAGHEGALALPTALVDMLDVPLPADRIVAQDEEAVYLRTGRA
jgi:seryl-tRNA synthetase